MPATTLSRSAFERLTAELEDLRTRGRIEIARKIAAARALGDLTENGDYHAAKDAQGHMETRIRQLEALLKDAVLTDSTASSGVVEAGSVVGLRYEGEGDVERYLVGSVEERHDRYPILSANSPLGQALLGHGPGATVEYEAPSGKLRVTIVEVGPAEA